MRFQTPLSCRLTRSGGGGPRQQIPRFAGIAGGDGGAEFLPGLGFGFAAGQYGALIRTTTGGAAWDIIKTGLGFNINSIRFFNNSNGIIVSTGGEIAETADGGLTWKVIVGDNNGVNNLEKVVIKDAKTIFGIQNRLIVKYDLP